MVRLLKGFGSVLLALVLFYGWRWTTVLERAEILSNTHRIYILAFLTFVFIIQQIYLVIPKATSLKVVDDHREVVQFYLNGFLSNYYKQLNEILKDPESLPMIRINVMLPTKKLKGLLGQYLKIYYYACPSDGVYTDEELELRWGRNNGTSGWAWNKKKTSIFDSIRDDLKLPEKRLNKKQRELTKHINSAVSIPIWYGNKIVGILNLDSDANINETQFIHEDIITLTGGCAKALGPICFYDGVNHNWEIF